MAVLIGPQLQGYFYKPPQQLIFPPPPLHLAAVRSFARSWNCDGCCTAGAWFAWVRSVSSKIPFEPQPCAVQDKDDPRGKTHRDTFHPAAQLQVVGFWHTSRNGIRGIYQRYIYPSASRCDCVLGEQRDTTIPLQHPVASRCDFSGHTGSSYRASLYPS